MSDTGDQDDSQGSVGSKETLSELCERLCQLMRTRSSGQNLETVSASIVSLCSEYGDRVRGRARISLKSFAVKGSPRLADLVSSFEICRDLCALEALLLCVDSFLNIPRNLKRIRLLVGTNAVFSLIKCWQYFSRSGDDGFESDGTRDHLAAVLLILAPKDRKSGLKLRLTGFLQQTVMEVCRAGKDAPSCLLDVLIFAGRSGRNAVAMGKQKDFISWLVDSLDNSAHFSVYQVKRNSQLLFFLSRTRKNRQKLFGLGCIPILLNVFKTHMDTRDEPDYTEICLVTLGCLKQMAKTKVGKDQLVSSNGLSVCEKGIRTCSQDLAKKLTSGEAAAVRELHRSLCALCMRCLPSTPYPLAQVPFPLTFPLPSEAKLLRKNYEDDPESDEDEEEDEEMDMIESEDENDAHGPNGSARNKKTKGDFSQYQKYFLEFDQEISAEWQRSSEVQSATSSPVWSVRARPATGTKLLKKKRSSSLGGDAESVGGKSQTSSSVKSRNNSVEKKERKGGAVKGGSGGKRIKGTETPVVDERDYMETAKATRNVMPFVKVAFPDWKTAFPDLPLQPLKDFPRAVEHNVVAELQKFKETVSFSPRVVYDLDGLLKLDRMRTSNGKADRNNDLERIGKMDPSCDHLKFESRFESGNLRRAVQVGCHEYELHLSPDINQLGQHFQWFYFETSNMVADIPYSFKIVNCLKSHSMFSNGMQPVLFSVSEAAEGRPGWVRAGHGVCYYRNLYTQLSKKKATESRGYYSAAFSITFRHPADVCYIAYHFPYTYTMLQCQLSSWKSRLAGVKCSVYFRVDRLCQTLSGNDANLVTITSGGPLEDVRKRRTVFLSARVHPGESNASWTMLGSIRFLLSDHPKAAKLRKAFVFKIVPMLNPDGVINGSHRCSLGGQDLNRQWSEPNPILHPTIFHSKALLSYMDAHGRTPLVFCDFHGHSRRSNVFVYGNNPEESWWPPDHTTENNGEYLEVPEILDVLAPSFSLNDCRFVVEKAKEPSARVATWRQFGIRRAYTMEATYCGFDQGPYAGFHAGTRELAEMGERFCEALLVLKEKLSITQSREDGSSSSDLDA